MLGVPKHIAGGLVPPQQSLPNNPTAPTTESILIARGTEYGKFQDHAKITQQLIRALLAHATTPLSNSQAESMHMICHKLGRIVNGNPNNIDSWDDIAGYAKLVADELRGVLR